MAVSVFFSLNLYRISTTEINNRLGRQITFIGGAGPETGVQFIGPGPGASGSVTIRSEELEQQRKEELQASKEIIIRQLVYANIVILISGGLGSYLLARRTIQPIEEAHAAQSRFTADASHELRTPLAVMRAETEVALRSPKLTIKEARNQLKSNLEELERLTQLSEGLLQLARGSGNNSKEDDVKISTVVATAVKQQNAQAKAKNMELRTQKIPDVEVRVNQTQLVQALVILIDNAIKYSPKGSHVKVTAKKFHNHLALKVTDDGPGMSEDELSQVFERFYRADRARSSSKTPGYGLGLAIAQQIVESHSGSLTATSKPGKGSVFTITLPTQ